MRLPLASALLASVTFASTVAGCAAPGARPAAATPAGAKPEAEVTSPSLEEQLARENGEAMPLRRVHSEATGITLAFPAATEPTLTPHQDEDGSRFDVLAFGIGSDVPVTCQLRATALDHAHVFANVEDAVDATLAAPPRVTVEVHEGRTLLGIEGDGQVTAKDGVTRRHFLKYAGVDMDGGGLFCVHDGVGYRKTFHATMAELAAGARAAGERPALHNVEVLRQAGRVTGVFVQRAYASDAKGVRRETSLLSAIRADGSRWAAVDSGWSGEVDAGGVLRERKVRRFGGTVVVDMSLERKSPGRYAYEGTLEGKPRSGTFTTKTPLVTLLSRTPVVAATAKGARAEASFAHFDESKPEAAVESKAKRIGPGLVRITEGDTTLDCAADDRGLCTKLTSPSLPVTFVQLYSHGTLPALRAARR